MKCDDVPLPELIRGELPEEAVSAVQAHIATCRKCRERARVMALLETSGSSEAMPIRRRFRALSLAAAVVLAGALLVLWRNADVDKTESNLAASWATDQAYPYVGLTTRGDEDSRDRGRREAFSAYQRGDYAAAARRFARLGSDPEASFYLGVSLYLSDEPHAASRYLSEAAKTESWRDPARWYLANALLKQGDVTAAGKQLAELEQVGGEFGEQARRLLDKLKAVSNRFP